MYKGLKDKSVLNNIASELLSNNPNYFYDSSVHCSYYSCFQVIKYIVMSIFNESDDDIYRNRRVGERIKSEHNYLIEKIHVKFIELNEVSIASNFKNKIIELKSLRTVSDYKPRRIEKEESDHAIKLSVEIISILKKQFNYE